MGLGLELELALTLALTRKCADQLTHAPWHTRPPRLLAQAVLEVGTAVGAGALCECSAARLAQGRLIARQPRLARAPAVLGRLINRLTSMTKCRLMTIRRLVIRRRALDYVSNGARLRPADWQARRVLGGRVGRS